MNFKLPSPKTSREYPLYIIGYTILIFSISFLFSFLSILNRISDDGAYVEYYPCILESTDDYGKPTCEEFGEEPDILVPVGNWLKDQAFVNLCLVSIITLPVGFYFWQKFNKSHND